MAFCTTAGNQSILQCINLSYIFFFHSAARMESKAENCGSCRLAEIKVMTLMTRVRGDTMPPKNIHETFIWLLNPTPADDLLLWRARDGMRPIRLVQREEAGWIQAICGSLQLLTLMTFQGLDHAEKKWCGAPLAIHCWLLNAHWMFEKSVWLKFLPGQGLTFTSTFDIHFTQAKGPPLLSHYRTISTDA